MDDVRNGWICEENKYKLIGRDSDMHIDKHGDVTLIPWFVYECTECGKWKFERDYTEEEWYSEDSDDDSDDFDYTPWWVWEEEPNRVLLNTNVEVNDSDLPF